MDERRAIREIRRHIRHKAVIERYGAVARYTQFAMGIAIAEENDVAGECTLNVEESIALQAGVDARAVVPRDASSWSVK